MKKKLSLFNSGWIVPLFLLLVAALVFGPLLPRLGFYWDDWAKILVSRLWGLRAYVAYYAEDRPISAWTHIALTPILGASPLPWHLLTLLLRWLSAWGLWWGLNGIWPAARRQNLVAALLFLVYPVFIQQPAAVTFHQQWLQYALFFLSLGAMVAAQRRPARFWLWSGVSILTMLLQLSVTEYFVPLELIRPFVLWLIVCPPEGAAPAGERLALRRRLGRTALAWAPYLALLAVYTLWRLFFQHLSGADPYRANTLYAFLANPVGTLRQVSLVVMIDELRILVTTWADLLYLQMINVPPFTLLSYAAGAGVGLLSGGFLWIYSRRQAQVPPAGWVRQAALLGLVAVLLGPLPAWITGRQVVFDFHSNRYAMPAMFGAALLFAAGIEWLVQRRLQVALLVGVLVALSAGLHMRVANDYRWLWTDEQRFFWQLSWRAPNLQAPTALFLEEEPFPNQGLFSTSAALNLVYPQPPGWGAQAGPSAPAQANRLAYWVYALKPRYRTPPASLAINLTSTFRTLQFNGQTPDSLLLAKDALHANCLWVLRPTDTDLPYLSPVQRAFLPVSNQSRILGSPAAPGYPPVEMLGPEPPHTWCYYFEKADLARQLQDWQAISRLAAEAKTRGYGPQISGSNAPYEWLPFIEGLARAGDWSEAARLTRRSAEQDAHYQPMLCRLWTQNSRPQRG